MTCVATPDVPHPLAQPLGISPLLMGLLNALNDESTSYCYWRSCRRLGHALAHRTPQDLVIKLHTTPEIVERREPDMNPLIIRQRVAWLEDLKFLRPTGRFRGREAPVGRGEP